MGRNYARRQFDSPSLVNERRATPENPQFSLNDPAAWDAFGGGQASVSGVPVTHYKAMTVAAVWQCVSQISGDISKLALEPKKTDRDSTVDKNHPSYRLVRRQWNNETPAFQGWRTALIHALLWGDGFAFIERNGRGDPIGLYNLLPDQVSVERIDGRIQYVYSAMWNDTVKTRNIDFDDMLHIRGISLDGTTGLDFVIYARDALGVAIATEQFQGKYFKSGIRTGGILEIPRETSNKAKDKLEEGFSKAYAGPDNWFKTVILRDGAKFHAAQSSMRDAQMQELEEGLVRKVARFFNVAPSRVGLSDSVSYNSKAEDNQSYLDSTLSPWTMAITSECWMKLLSAANQNAESHEFVYDVRQLLRLNRIQRYQVYAIGRDKGILTPNECRLDDDMPPAEDEGANDLKAPTVATGGADKGGATPPRGPADQSGGEAPVTKVRQVLYEVTLQARHKAQKPKAFIEWIDGNLVSHRKSALDLLGSDSVIDKWRGELRNIAEQATNDGLRDSIEAWATNLEAAA